MKSMEEVFLLLWQEFEPETPVEELLGLVPEENREMPASWGNFASHYAQGDANTEPLAFAWMSICHLVACWHEHFLHEEGGHAEEVSGLIDQTIEGLERMKRAMRDPEVRKRVMNETDPDEEE